MIPSVFAFGGNPKKLLTFIMLTRAASNNPTGAHDARPKSAMNTAYVLMFATWAGKVFASLIKLSSLSNTKLGNNLCLKTLLCEHQFSGIFLLLMYSAILHGYGSRLYYRKTTIGRQLLYKHAYFGLITHFLKYMYKVFSYAISFLVFASGALVVVFMHFCVALFAYKEALSQNTSICTRILSYIIVNWSKILKHVLKSLLIQ